MLECISEARPDYVNQVCYHSASAKVSAAESTAWCTIDFLGCQTMNIWLEKQGNFKLILWKVVKHWEDLLISAHVGSIIYNP